MKTKTELLREHPLPDAMRADVLARLEALERDEDIRVLYCCESGSRAWGFASPDSDFDVRFIYVRRPQRYITVQPERDVIERPITDILDISGWDLRKALHLGIESNATLVEWLQSPLVYCEDEPAVARLRELTFAAHARDRNYHHYLAMARKTFKNHLQDEEVKYKKYLYALRSLLAARWARERDDAPPMVFAELAEATLHEADIAAEINRLLEVKMRSVESDTSERWPLLHAFIENELAAGEKSAPMHGDRVDVKKQMDAFLFECAMTFGAGDRGPA